MAIDSNLLLYSLAQTFSTILLIKVDPQTNEFIASKERKFSKLSPEDKLYYTRYATKLSSFLTTYIDNIYQFEVNSLTEDLIPHNFRIKWNEKKCYTAYISLSSDILLNNVFPKDLPKILKNKTTTYSNDYDKLNTSTYKKIKSSTKYSELSAQTKEEILNSFSILANDIIVSTPSTTTRTFYKKIFFEAPRLVIKLFKNRFVAYDFELQVDPPTKFTATVSDNNVKLLFDNGSIFNLRLKINSPEIKKYIPLKFITKFENIDEMYQVGSGSI